jgi:hypothetical protein
MIFSKIYYQGERIMKKLIVKRLMMTLTTEIIILSTMNNVCISGTANETLSNNTENIENLSIKNDSIEKNIKTTMKSTSINNYISTSDNIDIPVDNTYIIDNNNMSLIDNVLENNASIDNVIDDVFGNNTSINDVFVDNLDNYCYSDEDLYLLAQVIDAEASDVCSDEQKMWTGQVILNRVRSNLFPDTLREVVYMPNQYQSVMENKLPDTVSDRSLNVAIKLLNGETVCDDDVIFQAEFPQGNETVKVIYNKYLDTYTYYCR